MSALVWVLIGIAVVLLLVVAIVTLTQLPEIRRYRKIKQM